MYLYLLWLHMRQREANCCKTSKACSVQLKEFLYICTQHPVQVQKSPFMHVEADSQLSPLPARIPLRSQHLRCVPSRPAEFNINYRQDVATLCMDTNKSDSVAAYHATRAHTWSMRTEGLLRKPWPCKPSQSFPPAAVTGLPPPAFSTSPVLIRPIGFTAPSHYVPPP